MRIVVTGGAGYIGSHTVAALLTAGHDVLILDNFSNAEGDVPDRVAEVAGRPVAVVSCDIMDAAAVGAALVDFCPDAVLHFAGLKSVSDAAKKPLDYFQVNVAGSVTLFQEMAKIGCSRLIFSSSATVYGEPKSLPITETHTLCPTNPYGRSKFMVENIIEAWGRANPKLAAINLRYFNPVGAHPTAKIGESPRGVPNNLVPYVAQVAYGQREHIKIFGDDYSTHDGTGVRDFIHVMDISRAHVSALELTENGPGVQAINLGSGRGYSVLDVISTFEAVSGRKVPFITTDRRPGDVAISVASAEKAKKHLGWCPEHGLDDMCRDAWAWQCRQTR